MKRDFNPVDVELSIENPSIERGAFYRLCFITESDIAPRTLKVTRLQDLLENGYSRLDLAYNFCVGVFSQQGIDTVYIRAKRSSESYVEAYNSDVNSMYYFVVLQTKDLTEVEKFNSHLVGSDEMKLQFFSQNVGSKIFQSPKIVNYYQDYTLSGGVPVESKDYYLNKAYSGVTVDSKIPLPDYLLGGYGNTAVDYGVRMMVGKDYIWEIDKPNRQIKYARSVVESGWVASREESTINNSEVTVVANKGRSGKILRASIKDPKVKIETISRQFLSGLGGDLLNYTILQIDSEAVDWVMDAENNRIKYTSVADTSDPTNPSNQYYYQAWSGGSVESPIFSARGETREIACTKFFVHINSLGIDKKQGITTDNTCFDSTGNPSAVVSPISNPPKTEYISIPAAAAQVISNAESGHLESQAFLKSIPLFAYLLTGSGTEAVNKAVLDIDAEATDWVLDPDNNAVKFTVPNPDNVQTQYTPVSWGSGTWYDSPSDACNGSLAALRAGSPDTYDDVTVVTDGTICRFNVFGNTKDHNYKLNSRTNPAYDPENPDIEKYISIDTVAQKVISNAEASHAPSQEALRLSTVERVDIGEYDEALEAASTEIDTPWKYLPIYDVAVQVKRNSIAGHAESIEAVNNSLPFVIPNYEPNVTITGTAKVGEVLTATVTDKNGVPSNINYQWYAGGEVILGATTQTYVPNKSVVGKSLSLTVKYTDLDGYFIESKSESTLPIEGVVEPILPVDGVTVYPLTISKRRPLEEVNVTVYPLTIIKK